MPQTLFYPPGKWQCWEGVEQHLSHQISPLHTHHSLRSLGQPGLGTWTWWMSWPYPQGRVEREQRVGQVKRSSTRTVLLNLQTAISKINSLSHSPRSLRSKCIWCGFSWTCRHCLLQVLTQLSLHVGALISSVEMPISFRTNLEASFILITSVKTLQL